MIFNDRVELIYKKWLEEEKQETCIGILEKKYFSVFHPRRKSIPCYFMYSVGLKMC